MYLMIIWFSLFIVGSGRRLFWIWKRGSAPAALYFQGGPVGSWTGEELTYWSSYGVAQENGGAGAPLAPHGDHIVVVWQWDTMYETTSWYVAYPDYPMAEFQASSVFGYFCWTIGDLKSFTESSHKVPADYAGGLVEKPLFLLCFPSRMGDSQSQVRLSQGDAFLVILSNAIDMYWTVWVSCSNMFKDVQTLGSSRNVGGSLSKYQHLSA